MFSLGIPPSCQHPYDSKQFFEEAQSHEQCLRKVAYQSSSILACYRLNGVALMCVCMIVMNSEHPGSEQLIGKCSQAQHQASKVIPERRG